MKIFKSPSNLLFDTENKNVIEWLQKKPDQVISFNQVMTPNKQHNYLLEKFPAIGGKIHPILTDFYNSNYYFCHAYLPQMAEIRDLKKEIKEKEDKLAELSDKLAEILFELYPNDN